MSLADAKFVSCATFRRSGDPVRTPTWIVALDDGRVGFWTSSASGKIKRLRNNPALTLTPCDSRGKITPGAATSHGTATIVTSGAEFDLIQSRVRARYGIMVGISRLFNTLGHLGKGSHPYGDTGIVVTLEPDSTPPSAD